MNKKVQHSFASAVAYVRAHYGIKDVIDAAKELTIDVRRDDGAKGIPRSLDKCAIHCAALRQEKSHGLVQALVLRSIAILVYKRHGEMRAVRFTLPQSTQKKVWRYDIEGLFPEGRIRLVPCDRYRRLKRNGGVATTNGHGEKSRHIRKRGEVQIIRRGHRNWIAPNGEAVA